MAGPDEHPPPGRPVPALRASDSEREQIADVLRHAAGEGRLTVDELDERLDATYAAVTHEDLDRLVADVVVPAQHRDHLLAGARADALRRDQTRVPVRVGDDGEHWLVAVMGGVTRKGRWRLGRQCHAINVMGGSDLDLCDAELADHEVDLNVYSIMGGSEIRIPDNMNVKISDFALMGGNEAKIGEHTPDPGGPVVHIRLISVMGGSTVIRGRKLSRKERKAKKLAEREQQQRQLGH
ncbi:MAG: DUF1707 and DUF2154 domain-containing protein [Patulibacter sp.]|nr:DUF1707 and DUF2154 domain-containing protein [Patulibacter sp.]